MPDTTQNDKIKDKYKEIKTKLEKLIEHLLKNNSIIELLPNRGIKGLEEYRFNNYEKKPINNLEDFINVISDIKESDSEIINEIKFYLLSGLMTEYSPQEIIMLLFLHKNYLSKLTFKYTFNLLKDDLEINLLKFMKEQINNFYKLKSMQKKDKFNAFIKTVNGYTFYNETKEKVKKSTLKSLNKYYEYGFYSNKY